jgi:hypothetical protein
VRARGETARTFRAGAALVASSIGFAAVASPVHAAPQVSAFSLTPSTAQAGGHPSLTVVASFGTPTAVKTVALHLPTGLTADSRAPRFCSERRVRADLGSPTAKVGSITILGEVSGLKVEVTKKVFNLKPVGTERLRLGVPLFGSLTQPGAAILAPVTARPSDNGLDIVTDLPIEVLGHSIRVKEVRAQLRGLMRARVKGVVLRKAYLTNPRSCLPAQTVLEVTSHEDPSTKVTASSSFTPTGCS